MKNRSARILLLAFCLAPLVVQAQKSTRIQGNTEINVNTENTTAVATGENNVAKNRVGVIKGDKKGDTKINVNAANVTTVVSGRNKKACTNIGSIVSDECK
ncbi:MAG: hypothetical protein HY847_19025 [Betaproteobacteria bacterium]|nr:hypothetical protein [Betaproteobacteria bacterium]